MAKSRHTEDWEQGTDDGFLADDAYDLYGGEDLSDDPMLADEKKKRRPSKKQEREAARREAEKQALKAEILAELRQENAADEDTPRDGEEEELEGEKEPKGPSRFTAFMMSFLSGNILSRQEARKAYPYLLFVAFLAFVYIGNVFRMQQLHRKHEKLTVEVRELRDKSMTIASEKMKATRQSNIIREIERRGLPLKESLTPNKTIQR